MADVGLTDVLPVTGVLTASVFDPDGSLVDTVTAPNVMCTVGLTAIASALVYAGIADQAASLGVTSATILGPLWGAVGNGSGTPAAADVTLFSELGRGYASAGAYVPASPSAGAQVTWVCFFGTSSADWTITEAGVFAQASSAVNTGVLLDHASLAVTKLAAQTAALQLMLTIG